MRLIVFQRSLSHVFVRLAVRAGAQGLPTARWQDKGARGALRDGRAFSRAYIANSRGAPVRRSLRLKRFVNDIYMMARCAGPRQ